MSPEDIRPVYVSGECEIDLARRELRVLGSPVPVGGRAFEIIEVLAEAAGELVTKDELMNRIWPGAVVMESALQVHAVSIRKALGPYRSLLKTESRRGYRLLGSWTVQRQDAPRRPSGLQRMSVNGESPRTNLPVFVTRLVGRAATVQRLRDLVSAYRVVTLTGPGGIGKTTLALKVARRVLGDFDDGGWLVELASLSDPDLVPSTVASILSLKISGATISADSVAGAIGGQQLLLVLDNCEHVIDAVAKLTETLVRRCPRTMILATSREVLRIDGEYVYRVPSLEVPMEAEQSDHILGHSAVELFITRTKALESDFSPRAEELPSIAAICRRLDGIPLAIEFAAARAATLGVRQVAIGLRDRFALLISGRRTALPRHRTLRATLDWSYALLSDAEQVLLRHLAVFAGGFTVEAVAAVMRRFDDAAPPIVDGVTSLVAKSLAVFDQTATPDRWRLLDTIQAYVLEKLDEGGESDGARRRHAAYYRDLFAPEFGSGSRLTRDDAARRVREIDNVRAALDWAFSPVGDKEIGIDLTAAYGPVWLHMSLPAECRERCERALLSLERAGDLNMRRQAHLNAALGSALTTSLGPTEQTKAVLTRALEAAESLNDFDLQARVLLSLSGTLVFRGEYSEASAAVERLHEVAVRIGDPALAVVADRRLGITLSTTGRLAEAQECLERVLRHTVQPADQPRIVLHQGDDRVMARGMLARVLCLRGFADRAHDEAQASVGEATERRLSFCYALYYGLCRTTFMTGDLAGAEQAIALLSETATSANMPFMQVVTRFLEGKFMVARGEFARGTAVLRDAFDTCRRTGWRASYPEFMGALAEGLAGLGRLDEAFDAVNDAVASAGQGTEGQVWFVPELLRIKGELLLRQDADQYCAAANECFDQATELAREQGALLWELRVALGLARLRMTQGRQDEARRLLAPIYDRFTEGFGTADLRAARAMLESLRSRPESEPA
jgi:predicted ATPase/DNA-binding winged helix-turn-helix (wHTH) protein